MKDFTIESLAIAFGRPLPVSDAPESNEGLQEAPESKDWPSPRNDYWHDSCHECERGSFAGPKRVRHCWICENSPEHKERERQFRIANLTESLKEHQKQSRLIRKSLKELQ